MLFRDNKQILPIGQSESYPDKSCIKSVRANLTGESVCVSALVL